jgi:hypothetical protein
MPALLISRVTAPNAYLALAAASAIDSLLETSHWLMHMF